MVLGAAFPAGHGENLFRHMFTALAILLFIPSQMFWLWQVRGIGRKFVRSLSARRWAAWVGIGLYLALLALNLLWPTPRPEAAHLTLRAALLQAPFRWWMLASLLGFVAMGVFYLCALPGPRRLIGYTGRLLPPADHRSERLLSPERRHFLARTAVAVSATPFAACAYGMLYERTEVETTHQRIMLGAIAEGL